MSSCAPGNVNGNDRSCLSISALRKIASAYNKQNPSNQIKNINSLSKDMLWKDIRNRLLSVCQNDESCWIEQNFILNLNDNELINQFKPKKPPGKYQWLGTGDIHSVMEQYEKKYPTFSFLGPVPINFSNLSDQLVNEVNNLNLAEAYGQGIRQIGVVFNMSPWYPSQKSSGSHWVALWIDLNKKVIAFFDSYGMSKQKTRTQVHCIPIQIQELIKKLTQRYPIFDVKCNTVQHQRANSECGIYSMYFIKKALEGVNVDTIFRNIKLDDEMNRYRNVFFRS